MTLEPRRAILLIHCPDQKGLVASITRFIYERSGNITYLDQHVDLEEGVFFMRVVWDLEGFLVEQDEIAPLFEQEIAQPFGMTWSLYFTDQLPNMAVFVSKDSHCLYDILARYRAGEWRVNIPLIISNHQDLAPVAHQFGVNFYHLPISSKNKAQQEKKQLEMLSKYEVNFLVLARYMQIISGEFIQRFPNKIINIHHSFLPAFPGAKPYHSAYQRGVKIIGATSHYVTEDLDAGPIIEQDVVRVSHGDRVTDMIRLGRDLEKVVLARAIWNHLSRRTLVYKNRTVVFR